MSTRLLAATGFALVASVGSVAASAPAMAAGPGAGSPAALAAPASDNTKPCSFATVSACQSTDPTIKTYVQFGGSTNGCTFDISVNWGDNSKTKQVFFTNPPDGTLFLASHTYPYSNMPMTFTISVSGSSTGGCQFNPGSLSFTLLTCTSSQLSGPSWAGRFPDSKLVHDLTGTFRKDASNFIAAMRHAGVNVRPI